MTNFKANVQENKPGIRESIGTHQHRYYRVITRQAQFMLAIGSRQRCPYSELKGWFLFLVANASTASRQKLVRLLTHPAVHPMYIQFLFGRHR
jgi:hypothetical protein